jgi:protein-tyrosine phosphatase
MKKILFVCHGNICRSPMAEFVFKNMLEKEGRKGEFYVASAATSSEEIWNGRGNPAYPTAKEELRKHGISCEGKRAVQIIPADYDEYDLIIGMDGANIRNMHRIFGGDPKGKIRKLLDYAQGGDISDPWYSGDFEATYRDVCKGCQGLLKEYN